MRLRPIFWSMAALTGFGLSAEAAFVDFTTIPNGSATSFTLGGVTVTGSSNVTSGNLTGNRGLGIAGGGNDLSVDRGETLTIDYGQLVTNVTVRIVDIPPPGNVTYSFQAFNGATSLGTFAVPPHVNVVETKDISALDGDLFFTRITFSISESPPLGLQFQATGFTPVPEPSSLALCGVAGLMGLGYSRRRRLRVAIA